MLKFASRVKIVSEEGDTLYQTHRAEAERLLRNGQAFHREKGKFVRELVLPDRHPGGLKNYTSNDSRKTLYMETLDGGSKVLINTPTETREVVTQPCHTYKLKRIPHSVKESYKNVVREATVAQGRKIS